MPGYKLLCRSNLITPENDTQNLHIYACMLIKFV